jgi:hypothetical protein
VPVVIEPPVVNGELYRDIVERRGRLARDTQPEPLDSKADVSRLIRVAVRHEMERHHDKLIYVLVIACATVTIAFAVAFAFAMWGEGR